MSGRGCIENSTYVGAPPLPCVFEYVFKFKVDCALMSVECLFSMTLLRERLRQFPSLVNCCTIDWFKEWPNDALEAVAIKVRTHGYCSPRHRVSFESINEG
jgi:hypothetical protein